jgi:hypothetical protein
MIDQGPNPVKDMWKVARVPGLTYEGTAPPHDPLDTYGQIDLPFLRCLLLPE